MAIRNTIRILTQYFYPDVASTGQLLSELALGLVEKKISVSVLTAFPSYSYKISAQKRENFKKVNILRLWTTKFNKNTKLGQLFNSSTFFLNIFLHLLFSSSKAPLLIVSNPPFLPIVGYLIKKLRNVNYIYLIHDVYPEKAYKLKYTSEENIFIKIWALFDKKVIENASSIVVLSESMKKVVYNKIENYRIDKAKKIIVIHNWADGEFIKPLQRSENLFVQKNSLENKFVILYSGNIGASYDLEVVIETANIIKDENVLFLFIGDGVKKNSLEYLVEEHGIKNVMFMPYQLKEMLPYSLTCPSISVVTYESSLEGLLMPSKLYTTLASGVPVVGLCLKNSEVGRIIEEAECGVIIEGNKAEEFAEYILKLKNDVLLQRKLGENARKYFENNFTLEIAVNKYYNLLNS